MVHKVPSMLRFRIFAIACGDEDADDCDARRTVPLVKRAVGQAPENGRALCSKLGRVHRAAETIPFGRGARFRAVGAGRGRTQGAASRASYRGPDDAFGGAPSGDAGRAADRPATVKSWNSE